MKPKILLASLAAAATAAAALVVSTGSAATTSDSSVAYVVQFQGSTALIDVPPKAKGGILHDPRPGDALISRSRVLDATAKHVGRTSEMCTMTIRRPVTYDCSLIVRLDDGSQLLLHGAINPMRTPWTAAVTGGTGRYAGARGTVRVSDLTGKLPAERWAFNLIP